MVTTVFFLLMVKHFVCDFALQGRFKQKGKHLLTSTKGHMHALDHALGTALVFLFVASFAFAQGKTIFVTVLLFPIFDYVFHFLIDWLKSNFVEANNLFQHDRSYWVLTSVDQSLHALTYFVMVILFDIYFF